VVVSHTGAPLGAATVALTGLAIGAVTTGTGAFTISNVPAGWQGTVDVTRIGYQALQRPAREGRSGYWFVLHPPAASTAAVASSTTEAPSPLTAASTIRAGVCRLLGVVKADAGRSVIVRLLLRTP
jgi:hypothetical protein